MASHSQQTDLKLVEEKPMASAEDVAAKLREIAADGIDIHRCAAVQALGLINATGNLEVLIEALLDEDEDVRTDAASALGHIGDISVADALLNNLLGDPSNDVKGAAIDSLLQLKADNVVPWLRKLVISRDEEIVWDDSDFYEGGWDDWVDIQLQAVRGLGEVKDAQAIPLIIQAMNDEFAQDMTELAFRVFSSLGAAGIEILGRFLSSPKELTRHRAAMALCKSDDPTAVSLIEKCLKDSSADIRRATALALLEKDKADPRLTEMLWDADLETRVAVLEKLGATHEKWTLAQIDMKEPEIVRAALNVIARNPKKFSSPDLSQKLQDMLGDADAKLETALYGAIAGVDGEKSIELLGEKLRDTNTDLDIRLAVLGAMEKIGPDTIPDLTGILGDSERQIRLTAMSILVQFAKTDQSWPNAAGEALMAALRGELVQEPLPEDEETALLENDEQDTSAKDITREDILITETMQPVAPFDPSVPAEPSAAMDAMAEAEREVAKAAEAEMYESVRPSIVEKVDEALIDATAELPTSTLGMILADENAALAITVKSAETLALNDNEQEFLEMSKNTLKKKKIRSDVYVAPYTDVKFFSAKLLGDLPYAEVAQELSKLIADGDKELRMAALDSLGVIGRELVEYDFDIVQSLMGIFNDPDRDIRMLCIRALANAPGLGTANMLMEVASDKDHFVRIEAARALGKIAQNTDPLVPFIQDADINVRLAASEAVSNVGGENAVQFLVDFLVQDGARYAKDTGRMLRRVNVQEANARILKLLEDEEQKMLWLFAINALDVLNAKPGANEVLV